MLDPRRLLGIGRVVDDELAFHIEETVDLLVDRGWSPNEARLEAERRFGDRGKVRHACQAIGRARRRDDRWTALLDELRQNLVFGVRQLWRTPGTTLAAIISLVAGIGAATALWSVAQATLVEPLPFPEADRLVRLWSTNAVIDDMQASIPDYLDWREQAQALEHVAAIGFEALALTDRDPPLRLEVAPVSASFFRALGHDAALGRVFSDAEDRHGGPSDVAVLSHRLFVDRWGADRELLGQSIDLDGRALTVIGVMPEGFAFPEWADLWIPLAPDPAAERGNHLLDAIARLAPGATFEQAQAEIDRIAAGIAAVHPTSNEGWGVRIGTFDDWLIGSQFRHSLRILLAAVTLLVVLAAVNVANLLVARGMARGHELSLRVALGAGRRRLVRQLVTEGLLLALLGGLGGLAFAYGTVALLHRIEPAWIPRWGAVTVDGPVVLFALAVTLAAGLLFALVPALHATGRDLRHALVRGGRGASGQGRRLRGVLVAIEVGVATVLLIGAGLLFDTFLRLQRVDPGFDSAQVLAVPIQLPSHRYGWGDNATAGSRIASAVAAIPGVEHVGLSNAAPFGGFRPTNGLRVIGRDSDARLMSDWRAVSPTYFEALGIPIVRGRPFRDADHGDAAPATIVSRSMADALWPEGDAVGGQIDWGSPGGRPLTVVGVAGDVRDVDLTHDRWTLYRPHRQLPWPAFDVLIRTDRPLAGLERELRQAIWGVDPDLPIPTIRPLGQRLDTVTERPRSTMALLVAFAAVALVLAASGLYGLTLFGVERRRQEIGIRLALGASPRHLVARIVRSGVTLALAGALAGTLAALAGSQFLASMLYGTRPLEGTVYLAVGFGLLAVAVLSSYLPARRVSRLDPATTLRAD